MQVGDLVDDFELEDASGGSVRLSSLLGGGSVVLFFYPVASSKGCTVEACHFRDLAGELAVLGARPVGISTDPVVDQQRFDERHGLGFPLLSDSSGSVARAFGVKRRFGPLPVRRATFVIGPDRRVLGVVRSELRMEHHGDEALRILSRARTPAGPGAGGTGDR